MSRKRASLKTIAALALALITAPSNPASARQYCELPSRISTTGSTPKPPETQPGAIDVYITKNKERWLTEDFMPFLRMDCTSVKVGEDLAKKTECAGYLEKLLEQKGFSQKVFVAKDTPKQDILHHPVQTGLDNIRPVVYFEIMPGDLQGGSGGSLVTVVFDSHYDGRPTNDNPKDPWKTSPFEPVRKHVEEEWHSGKIQDERIYARRAVDSAGHIMGIIWTLEAYQAVYRQLPVHVKVMFEGAEEIGSPGMAKFIEKYKEMLKANLVVIDDLWTNRPGIPIIEERLRGGMKGKLCVETAAKEGHSGSGSYLPNALGILSSTMNRVVNPMTKEVDLPSYAFFPKPTPEEVGYVKKLYPVWNVEERTRAYGAKALVGGAHPAAQTVLYPSWDWETIPAGENGQEGVIPSTACVSFSVRLVPGQDPSAIFHDLEKKLQQLPESRYAAVTARLIASYPAFQASLDNKYTPTIRMALQQAFGTSGLEHGLEIDWNGAGEPIASYLQSTLGAPVFLTGYGHPNDNPHATNEGMLVDHGLLVGVRANANIIRDIGKQGK
ncbi:M20/M25/M40 family metallo-hydrolase [Candidatus Woesearchaeota archaeon]|nr:M20/M25/M40 family metallo-hydrolase [Candidatus Woesearchaeota archaeon]